MNTYFVRQDGQTAMGPYQVTEIRGWLADGRLPRDAECSLDSQSWSRLSEVAEFAEAGAPRPAPSAFPEPGLYVRQGLNVQGPFAMSRIRRYVTQRRIQPYMLFSQDRVWWVSPEHVPGLIPDGYVPVTPPRRPTPVPDTVPPPLPPPFPAGAAPGAAPAEAPTGEVGSITLTGFRLDEVETAPAGSPPMKSVTRPPLPAARADQSYYLRQDGRESYGPYAEDAIRGWIAEGRVGPEMEFSTDGRTWVLGSRIPGLFPSSPGEGARPSKSWRDRR